MDAFNTILAAAAWVLLGRLHDQLTSANLSLIAAILAVPILLALLSRRLTAVVGTLFFAGGAFLAVADPARSSALIPLGACIAAFFVAFLALRARRRDQATQAELQELRTELNRLLAIEQRRALVELTSAKPGPRVTNVATE